MSASLPSSEAFPRREPDLVLLRRFAEAAPWPLPLDAEVAFELAERRRLDALEICSETQKEEKP